MKREMVWPLSTLLLTVLGCCAQFGGGLSANWWVVPWVLSLVLFGLPHGAVDHEVALRLWRPQPPPRWALGLILLGYLSVSGIILLGWFIMPSVIFLGFIGLTLGHWGLADLWWSWQRDSAYFRSRGHRLVFALWRGSLPMLVPVVVDPGLYRQVAEVTCNLFLREPTNFSWLEGTVCRGSALGLVLLCGVLDFFWANRAAKSRWLNAAEGASLLVFFSFVPTLAAVGFYFAFWHGLRHVQRVMAEEKWSGGQFARRSIPATLGALAMLGALAYFTQHEVAAQELLGLYLALIAALTVPHAYVVYLMDARVGLWENNELSMNYNFCKKE